MSEKRGNQWAYLESFSYNADANPVYSWGSNAPVGFVANPGLIRFEGIAPATPQILDAMQRWMNNRGGRFPLYAGEWMCLYCGSPNELPKTHCTQCGAPRNWLIG